MNAKLRRFCVAVWMAVAVLPLRSAEVVALTDLGLANLHFEGWKKPTPNRALNGQMLAIAKQKYERGIGTRATSTLWLEISPSKFLSLGKFLELIRIKNNFFIKTFIHNCKSVFIVTSLLNTIRTYIKFCLRIHHEVIIM